MNQHFVRSKHTEVLKIDLQIEMKITRMQSVEQAEQKPFQFDHMTLG